MAFEAKQYVESTPEGPIQQESTDGAPIEIRDAGRQQMQPEIVDHNQADPTRNSTVIILAEQGRSIVEEWRHDLAHGVQNPRELELYFAGKVDQHNMMIVLADLANPSLRESLPQQINFAELKSALEQEHAQQEQAGIGAPGYAI